MKIPKRVDRAMQVLYDEAAKADLKIGVILADDEQIVYNETAAEGAPHSLSLFNAFSALSVRVTQEYGTATAIFGLGKVVDIMEKKGVLKKALEIPNGVIMTPRNKV